MEAILKDIIHMMHHDYAGFKDKKGWDDPAMALEKVRQLQALDTLGRKEFVNLVKDYLLDFKDQHIYFIDHEKEARNEQNIDRGFKVRRYQNRLYVTQISQESRLEIGMCFNKISEYTILELQQKHHRLLDEQHAERENWMPILALYEYGEIEDEDGQTHIFTFNEYTKETTPGMYKVEKIKDQTLLLTMTDFMKPDEIASLMEKNYELLETTENWVIDVRVNNGGSDSSFHLLLPYIMPVEGGELSSNGEKMYFNCTKANAERILGEIDSDLNHIEDEQAKQFLNVFKREWKRNKGLGFVEFDFKDILPESFIKGCHTPKQIVVLSDVMCGSSGDSFVEICKKSNKVTVIGRATKGLNDYANLATETWEEGFSFMYPTSRLSRIDEGQGMSGKGIQPNLYIPWTPQHLKSDVDLKMALDYLSENQEVPTS